jgi:hypothetical protein
MDLELKPVNDPFLLRYSKRSFSNRSRIDEEEGELLLPFLPETEPEPEPKLEPEPSIEIYPTERIFDG